MDKERLFEAFLCGFGSTGEGYTGGTHGLV